MIVHMMIRSVSDSTLAVTISSLTWLIFAYTASTTISTTILPYQLAIAQTSGLANFTSENIEDLEIIQESINDAREDIHGNNTAEALEELHTANKALVRFDNDTFTATA
jgi:hypothetical protein